MWWWEGSPASIFGASSVPDLSSRQSGSRLAWWCSRSRPVRRRCALRKRRRNFLPDVLSGFYGIVAGLIEHIHADFHDYRAAIPQVDQVAHVWLEIDRAVSGQHEPVSGSRSDGVLDVN